MYEAIIYETPKGNSPIADFLNHLCKSKMLIEAAKVNQLIKLLMNYGPEINSYRANSSKKLQKDIYELRSGNIRIFYTHLGNEKYLILHAFIKKRNDTPTDEIDLAIKERSMYLKRDP